jgi:hypothetical protein
MFIDTYAKFYNPGKHSTAEKVNVPLKGWVILKPYIPKENKALIFRLKNFAKWLATCMIQKYTWKSTANYNTDN